MRKASWKDRDRFIEIFTEVFAGNTATTWVLRKNIKPRKGLRKLARYAFVKGMIKDGVYFSDERNSILVS